MLLCQVRNRAGWLTLLSQKIGKMLFTPVGLQLYGDSAHWFLPTSVVDATLVQCCLGYLYYSSANIKVMVTFLLLPR